MSEEIQSLRSSAENFVLSKKRKAERTPSKSRSRSRSKRIRVEKGIKKFSTSKEKKSGSFFII